MNSFSPTTRHFTWTRAWLLAIIPLSVGVFALGLWSQLHDDVVAVHRQSLDQLGQRVQDDFNQALVLGIPPDDLVGVPAYFEFVLANNPQVRHIALCRGPAVLAQATSSSVRNKMATAFADDVLTVIERPLTTPYDQTLYVRLDVALPTWQIAVGYWLTPMLLVVVTLSVAARSVMPFARYRAVPWTLIALPLPLANLVSQPLWLVLVGIGVAIGLLAPRVSPRSLPLLLLPLSMIGSIEVLPQSISLMCLVIGAVGAGLVLRDYPQPWSYLVVGAGLSFLLQPLLGLALALGYSLLLLPSASFRLAFQGPRRAPPWRLLWVAIIHTLPLAILSGGVLASLYAEARSLADPAVVASSFSLVPTASSLVIATIFSALALATRWPWRWGWHPFVVLLLASTIGLAATPLILMLPLWLASLSSGALLAVAWSLARTGQRMLQRLLRYSDPRWGYGATSLGLGIGYGGWLEIQWWLGAEYAMAVLVFLTFTSAWLLTLTGLVYGIEASADDEEATA